MRKIPSALLLWLFVCTVCLDDSLAQTESSAIVATTPNTAELEGLGGQESDSPEVPATEGEVAVPATLCSPCNIVEGVINDPPLEQTQEVMPHSTPAAQSPLPTVTNGPGAGITNANLDSVTADAILGRGHNSSTQPPLISKMMETDANSMLFLEREGEEAAQGKSSLDESSDSLGDLQGVPAELTTAERSETEPTVALNFSPQSHQPDGPVIVYATDEVLLTVGTTPSHLTLPQRAGEETSSTTLVDTAQPADVAATADTTDGSTSPLGDPIVVTVQDIVTPEGQTHVDESTIHGPSSLLKGSSVGPDIKSPSQTLQPHISRVPTPEQTDVMTAELEDATLSTVFSDTPDPELSFLTTLEAFRSQKMESLAPVEPLTHQPGMETMDRLTLLPDIQSEIEVNPSTQTTPAALGPTSGVQSSTTSTGTIRIITDFSSIPITTVDPTTADPTVASVSSLSYTDVTTTVQEFQHSQPTEAAAAAFSTTVLEGNIYLWTTVTDLETSPSLKVMHSTAEAGSDALTEVLQSTVQTEPESIVPLTLSSTFESTLTDDIQQITSQPPYIPTSMQHPEPDTKVPSLATSASLGSDGSTILEIKSSSQFTEMPKSDMMPTTLKPSQEKTLVSEVQTAFMAESTAGVSMVPITSPSVTAGSAVTSLTGGLNSELVTKTESILPVTLISSTLSSVVTFAGTSPSPSKLALLSSPISTTVNVTPTTSAASTTEIATSVAISIAEQQPAATTQSPTTTISMPPSTVVLPKNDITSLSSSPGILIMPSTPDTETTTDAHVSLMTTLVLPAFSTSENATFLPESTPNGATLIPEDVFPPSTDSLPSSVVVSDFVFPTVNSATSTTSIPAAVVTTVDEQVSSTSPIHSSTYSTLQLAELQTVSGTATKPQISTVETAETPAVTSVSQTSPIPTEVITVPVGTETTVVTQIPPTPSNATHLHTPHTTLTMPIKQATEQQITPKVGFTTPMKIKPKVTTEGTKDVVETSPSTAGPSPLIPVVTEISEITPTVLPYDTVAPVISRGLSIASAVSMGLIVIFVSVLLCVLAVSAVGGWLEYRKRKRSRRPQAVNLVRVERGGSEDFSDGWTKGRGRQQQQAWMTCQSAALQPPSGPRQEPLGKLARQCSCKRRRLLFPGRHHSLCMLHSGVKQTEELRALRVISLSDEDEEAISSESMLLSGIGRRRVSGASDVELAVEQAPEAKSTGKNSPILETEDGEASSGKKKWLFIDEV
ncbi:unnamed protein product [Schistocephalus solidus]|uniref:Mucin-20 n=1 Tax=Schistocephalus solidus TaxID=70667 RepID=A0A183SD15_SCHSO|nr:unnamed protein product [Schistocephalus solidus]